MRDNMPHQLHNGALVSPHRLQIYGLGRQNGNVPPSHEPLKSAATTLLSALENLMLIDERGESLNLAPGTGPTKVSDMSVFGRRRASERSITKPVDDSMDVDMSDAGLGECDHVKPMENGGRDDHSPLKRKRDASDFPLPDAKSQRLTAALSSRLARSLHVDEDPNDGIRARSSTPEPNSHATPLGPTRNPRSSSRTVGQLPQGDSCNSLMESLLEMSRERSSSSIALSLSPVFALSRENSQVALMDDASIGAWIQSQAQSAGLPVERVQASWNDKRKELEHNLTLLANGAPSDSYADLKSVTEKIVHAARWMSAGNLDELGDLVPAWRLMETNVENVAHFVRVVEDMKGSVTATVQLQSELPADLEILKQKLDEKAELWGDVLKDDLQPWRQLGFPVDDVKDVVDAAAAWICGLPWGLFVLVEGAVQRASLGNQDPATQSLMYHTYQALLFARDCAEFASRKFPTVILHAAYTLAIVFFQFSLSHFSQIVQKGAGKGA
ncbi:hypothetical protein BC832DRAFT_417803 [Gaertneriomyces semiglobifer]|nr:hypothetical protein BC832DRAFT_417803 [Gaertneriomyces semiglobifer]